MAEEETTATGSKPSSLIDSAAEDELVVAQILLDLRRMVDIVESVPAPKWRTKRKRSCLSEGAPTSPAPSRQRIGERKPQVKAKEEERASAAASGSPDTPLNFPRSESDEKLGRSMEKSSRKRSTHEYIDLIEELTERRDLLRKEIDKVAEYHNKLNAQNSQLKAMKQKLLNSCPTGRETGTEQIAGTPQLVSERTAQLGVSSNGPRAVNDVGPFVIPDLNVSAEEAYQPLDEQTDRRARSAEARRRRKGLMKSKATNPCW